MSDYEVGFVMGVEDYDGHEEVRFYAVRFEDGKPDMTGFHTSHPPYPFSLHSIRTPEAAKKTLAAMMDAAERGVQVVCKKGKDQWEVILE